MKDSVVIDEAELNKIKDHDAKEFINSIANLLENTLADNDALRSENQRLEDENNRLKGELRKPDV